MEIVNEFLPKLIVALVVLGILALALKSSWPKKCPKCGKRALKKSGSGCSCSRAESCCGLDRWICAYCGAEFTSPEELAGGDEEPSDDG